ncbi:glycogen/starch/alpha-glucan phosphorylase [Ideonella sp. A 288]|uniref:glycogen/starch/alpha-glucan phosphorylase n=1 Tax=Ideonella sp. A 288 TaxID=1962181 RepID=UPI001F1D694F|nr:glycogen/starch/alpha-glucan phosphorylase [Ideonella sp. A 288]
MDPLPSESATAVARPAADATGAAARFAATLAHELAQRVDPASAESRLHAAAIASRQLLAGRWIATQAADAQRVGQRRVHYLSMEFLIGRAMGNALAALGLAGPLQAQLGESAPPLAELLEHEPDAALGNGGLGRLAACFLDAFATLGLPSFGYGLFYKHGMFAQGIQDGRQVERPDEWMKHGNPWELVRDDVRHPVGFGGRVDSAGGQRRWVPAETLQALAHDFIVPGHGTERVSTLRKWQALADRPIDFAAFCRGEHAAASQHLLSAEALNWVLYPDDSTPAGRELRLRQEYFLVSASLQDMLARHLREWAQDHEALRTGPRPDAAGGPPRPAGERLGGSASPFESFGRHNAVHLNDTHPALAPAELMRLLIDEHGLEWDAAWQVTTQAVSYTNHTLMPEALETWSVRLFEALLPRHLEIVYEINRRFLEQVRQRFPGDEAMASRMSLIDESGERRVRMAALAIVASHKVNGVSALHSDLMVRTIFADYAALWPERFINVTNGVTPRRWLAQANPGLAALLDRHIGAGWRTDLGELTRLAPMAAGATLGKDFLAVKRANKLRLAEHIRAELGLAVDPDSLFDVQIKRIHEYKRQLLNVLHVVARHQAILAQPHAGWTPRTVIFAGKAASAYHAAKLVVQLIHDVARVVNSDVRTQHLLQVVFLPNYGVSLAEMILPAADLSEQISTAGTEASGTGNMKFALNGACTIGTWDGANIEMAQTMGPEQMFVFGLRADAVTRMKALGYDPRLHVEENKVLRSVLDAIGGGAFSRGEPDRYRALVQPLLHHDPYMLMADFADYVRTQGRVDAVYDDRAAWAERALRNLAGMGPFSVDRTIGEYQRLVWAAPT